MNDPKTATGDSIKPDQRLEHPWPVIYPTFTSAICVTIPWTVPKTIKNWSTVKRPVYLRISASLHGLFSGSSPSEWNMACREREDGNTKISQKHDHLASTFRRPARIARRLASPGWGPRHPAPPSQAPSKARITDWCRPPSAIKSLRNNVLDGFC